MATDVDIANMALASFGSAPIQSFDDSTPAGAAVALLYPLVMNGLLAEYPWNFCRQTVQLQQLAVADLTDGMNVAGWANAFELPGNMLGPPIKVSANNRYPDAPELRYEIEATTLYTNQAAVWVLGQFYVDESAWPPYFLPAAVACLAAEIVMPITGNASIRQQLQADAWGSPAEQRMGGKLGAARRVDARGQPSRILAHNPLIDVRVSTIEVIPTGSTFP